MPLLTSSHDQPYHDVIDAIETVKGKKLLLDIGAGQGRLLRYLEHAYPTLKLVAVEANTKYAKHWKMCATRSAPDLTCKELKRLPNA